MLSNIEGSFFVILIYRNTIYAFKDRYGIRPGLYGFDGEDILISSENNNNPFINIDIKPGEIITISDGILKKEETINYLKPCIFEYLYFSRASSKIYGLSVDDFRVKLAYLSKDLIKNQKIFKVWGSGKPLRELIFVDDIADACIFFMNKKIKALIAVGGTGGHVFPGINLASALIKKNYSVKMVTDKRGYKFFKEFT